MQIGANQKSERVVAFIPVRLSSSRLPEKHFRHIGDKTILEWLIHNLKTCKQLDDIVIATAAETENEPLKVFARQQKIPLFWYEGDINHVTTRLRLAAEYHKADICLLISGDCPLVYGPAVDLLIEEFRKSPLADILLMPANEHGEPPALEGVLISRLRAWQTADDLADRPELKEHQFPLFWMRPKLFSRHQASLPADLYIRKHRFSVDTWADLEFMNTLHDRLAEQNQAFELPQALQLLRSETELFKINKHVHQRKLIDETYKVLFIIDAGDSFGFGHLMRSLELARQLTELKGWSATFAIDDKEAAQYLRQQGEKTVCTTFQRPNRAEHQSNTTDIATLLPEYDLLVIDIYDQRNIASGWRQKLDSPIPVAVIDNRLPWTAEADLLISPSVVVPIEQQHDHNRTGRHLHGKDYLILRREIRRLKQSPGEKNLDLLIYLHHQDQRLRLKKFAQKNNLNALILDNFTDDLPLHMAAAKLFISGFGISFYEALALGTFPVCLPDSQAHYKDALSFYKAFNLAPLILDPEQNMDNLILPLLQQNKRQIPMCEDGTPRIVSALSTLMNGTRG